MRTYTSIIFLFLLGYQLSFSQDCSIYIADFEATECVDSQYGVSFSLLYENPTSEFVNISVNGVLIGEFELNEDIYVLDSLVDNGATSDVLTVCMSGDSDCCVELSYIPPCVCSITGIHTEIVECWEDGMEFYFFLDMDFQMTSDSFLVGSNNMNFGTFSYDNLPVLVGPISMSSTPYEILVLDQNNPFCFGSLDMGVIQNCDLECSLSDLSVDISPCTEDEHVYLTISFDYENTSIEGFEVRGNAIVYGMFPYGHPSYTIGPLAADCENITELVVKDLGHPDCQIGVDFDQALCCVDEECMIGEVSIDPLGCDGEGTYSLVLNFEYTGTANEYFDIWGADEYLGFYEFSDLPLTIENFPERDVEYDIITICENDNPDCCVVYEFMGLDCEDDGDCWIGEVFAEAYECDEGSNQVLIDVIFSYSGMVSDSFEIRGNGTSYGFYTYGQDYYTIGPVEADCETIYEIIIIDDGMDDCAGEFVFEEVLCCEDDGDCWIGEVFAEAYECDEGSNQVLIDVVFSYSGMVSDSFEIRGNGTSYGFYAYGQDYYTIGPVEADCETIYEIIIIDDGMDDCVGEFVFEEALCCEDDGECVIGEVSIDPLECDGEGTYSLVLNFDYSGTTNEYFEVWGADEYLGFYEFSDLPLTIENFPERDLEYDIITICENDNPNCCIEFEFMGLDCMELSVEDELINFEIIQIGETLRISKEIDSFTLYDLNARVVAKTNSQIVKTKALLQGLYIYHISLEGESYSNKIFIK